jgi:hypothetical protein
MINRRHALAGLAGLPISGALLRPVIASPAVISKPPVQDLWHHPIFGVQKLVDGGVSANLVCYVPPAHERFSPEEIAAFYTIAGGGFARVKKLEAQGIVKPLTTKVIHIEAEPERFTSHFEAEEALLKIVNLPPVKTWPPFGGASDWPVANRIRINREANWIAARTRVGVGDRVMVHVDDLGLLSEGRADVFDTIYEDRPNYGRWTLEGVMNKTLDVYTTDRLPAGLSRGQALIAYRGDSEVATGGFIAWDGERYAIAYRRPHPDGIAKASDFFGLVQLRPEAEFDA